MEHPARHLLSWLAVMFLVAATPYDSRLVTGLAHAARTAVLAYALAGWLPRAPGGRRASSSF